MRHRRHQQKNTPSVSLNGPSGYSPRTDKNQRNRVPENVIEVRSPAQPTSFGLVGRLPIGLQYPVANEMTGEDEGQKVNHHSHRFLARLLRESERLP